MTSLYRCIRLGSAHPGARVGRQYHTLSPKPKVETHKLTSNLELVHRASETDLARPTVLLFAWMAANPKHRQKYADYYLGKGFDVLHIGISPYQLLRPTKTQEIASSINDLLLTDQRLKTGNIVVHTFSVGAYVYGEGLVKFMKNPEKYKPVTTRIKGHIYDSPVGRRGIPEGLPKALTKNKLIISASSGSLNWYLKTFRDSVTRHYDLAEKTTLDNHLGVPILFLYSKADPVGGAHVTDPFKQRMKSDRIFSRCWADSPHVSHMHHQPQEYVQQLDNFMDEIEIFKA